MTTTTSHMTVGFARGALALTQGVKMPNGDAEDACAMVRHMLDSRACRDLRADEAAPEFLAEAVQSMLAVTMEGWGL